MAALEEDTPQSADADADKAAYSRAKRAAESIVRELAASANVPTRIARCFAFVGPWLPTDEHFAIGNFIGNALRGEPIVRENPPDDTPSAKPAPTSVPGIGRPPGGLLTDDRQAPSVVLDARQ